MKKNIFWLVCNAVCLGAFIWEGKSWPWIALMSFMVGVTVTSVGFQLACGERWPS